MLGTAGESKDELIGDILETLTNEHTSVGQTAKNLHSSALCRHWMLSRGLTDRN